MFQCLNEQHRRALEDILNARRTVRAFSSVPPAKEDIEAVIRAGLRAPFAAMAAQGKPDFRKIFVLPQSSEVLGLLAAIIKERIGQVAGELEKKMGQAPFVLNLRRAAEQGVPGVGNAPYYLIVAERKGTPPVAPQSLSYCLHQMWLKAVSLGIGFQLVSATALMENDPRFCQQLGLPCGEYALDGCALGHPADSYQPPLVAYPDYEQSVVWL